ncbi:MAG: D-glycero-beta-D-manno-heptose 1,7-bisphosphate 7-phosphatase [Candidatus Margulisiibacteriota bacterium]
MHKAVFLDKDGTINKDVGYLDHHTKLKVFPYSAKAIKMLNAAGYKVIVVSNQSGIARGFLTEGALQAIDKKLSKEILSGGGIIDAIYYCPHHPEHGIHPYKRNCECRKPATGMLKQAQKRFDLDLSQCYMIGDKLSDIEMGFNAGIKSILVKTGYGAEVANNPALAKLKPSFVGENLLTAAEWITK